MEAVHRKRSRVQQGACERPTTASYAGQVPGGTGVVASTPTRWRPEQVTPGSWHKGTNTPSRECRRAEKVDEAPCVPRPAARRPPTHQLVGPCRGDAHPLGAPPRRPDLPLMPSGPTTPGFFLDPRKRGVTNQILPPCVRVDSRPATRSTVRDLPALSRRALVSHRAWRAPARGRICGESLLGGVTSRGSDSRIRARGPITGRPTRTAGTTYERVFALLAVRSVFPRGSVAAHSTKTYCFAGEHARFVKKCLGLRAFILPCQSSPLPPSRAAHVSRYSTVHTYSTLCACAGAECVGKERGKRGAGKAPTYIAVPLPMGPVPVGCHDGEHPFGGPAEVRPVGERCCSHSLEIPLRESLQKRRTAHVAPRHAAERQSPPSLALRISH